MVGSAKGAAEMKKMVVVDGWIDVKVGGIVGEVETRQRQSASASQLDQPASPAGQAGRSRRLRLRAGHLANTCAGTRRAAGHAGKPGGLNHVIQGRDLSVPARRYDTKPQLCFIRGS